MTLENNKELLKKYEKDLEKYEELGIDGAPPCPRCGGEIEIYDGFLITINTCKDCEWSTNNMYIDELPEDW